MVNITGVSFKKAGKIYDFNSHAIEVQPGDKVIVETEQGLGFGVVVKPTIEIETSKKHQKILRIATDKDIARRQEIQYLEERARIFCRNAINDLNLVMNLFSVEGTFDRKKLTFFYTADGRVDFRELIKILIREFGLRIEMRQVGIRNLSKHCGGIGKCGREICCSAFMTNFDPVSIKMAKEQRLSLNPTKISGVCGRLMCCLNFENTTYKHLQKAIPKLGKTLQLTEGKAKVVRQNILKQSVILRLEDSSEIEKNVSELLSAENSRPRKKKSSRAKK